MGIDLVGGTEKASGATANDPGDADEGPNRLQNKPLIKSAVTSADGTSIAGELNGAPNQSFTVQLFSNPSGNEGEKFLGQRSVSTDSNGEASFRASIDVLVEAGHRIAATATDSQGNTSEFSAPERVVAQ